MKNRFGDSPDGSDLSGGFSFALPGGNPPQPQPGPQPGPQLVEASAEAQEAQAAVAESGPGGPGSTVAVTASSGFTINLEFDAAAMAAPAGFRAGIEQAAALLSAAIIDPITVNISIDYSGTGGGAAGGPTGGYYESYSTVHADLVNNASPGDTSFNSLPAGSSIAGQTSVAVWYSQLKLWGLVSPTGTEVDGSATFATDINSNLLVGVALHELTHAMGRVPYGPSSGQPAITQPDIFDFYRFTSAANILIDGDATAPAAYFSLNNGVTKLADYGLTSDSSDFLNSGLAGTTDPFDEFYSNNTQQHLTSLDLQQIDALGFHLAINQPTTVIEAFGSTELVQVGNDYFFDPVAGGTGPELMYSGTPWAAGQAWAPIGVEQTSTGYEVALLNASTHLFTIWNTDSSGNVLTASLANVSGTSTALESIETSFHQDLNGDGTIGVPAPTGTVIEAKGSTELVQAGNDYFFVPVAGGTGPELMYSGTPWAAGQAWAPIGVEQTSTGYEVALLNASTHLFTIWNTDSSGNVLTASLANVSGTSTALESIETSFHQDLNGDGIIGVPTATGPVASTPAAQAPSVTVVNNDTFVFRSGLGAGVTANAGSTDTTGHDGFAWVAGNAPAAAPPDAQAGMPHPVFPWADADPSHHDGAPAMNFHLIDPHAGGFIIG